MKSDADLQNAAVGIVFVLCAVKQICTLFLFQYVRPCISLKIFTQFIEEIAFM